MFLLYKLHLSESFFINVDSISNAALVRRVLDITKGGLMLVVDCFVTLPHCPWYQWLILLVLIIIVEVQHLADPYCLVFWWHLYRLTIIIDFSIVCIYLFFCQPASDSRGIIRCMDVSLRVLAHLVDILLFIHPLVTWWIDYGDCRTRFHLWLIPLRLILRQNVPKRVIVFLMIDFIKVIVVLHTHLPYLLNVLVLNMFLWIQWIWLKFSKLYTRL